MSKLMNPEAKTSHEALLAAEAIAGEPIDDPASTRMSTSAVRERGACIGGGAHA